ncbi:amino acid racemase [Aequorivita sp. Q41]|uniref:aspartate/glutamate racemase family protein n=1 Tax=Aequorivita sp. Q41 TaxID=3153300 RepID=UPI0032429F26
MKKIGLVGGISWTSTLDYYRYINEGVNQALGGLQSAEIILYSLNFADIQDRGWENSHELLLKACKELKKNNVEGIVLCANTAHLFADKIQTEIGLPIIDIVNVTASAIKNEHIKNVILLGTKFTMEMDFYKNKLIESGLNVLIPEDEKIRNEIHYIVKEELGKGIIKPKSKEKLMAICDDLIKKGGEGIVLGCTEIPLILSQDDFSIPVFDTTEIHSEAIVNFILS